MRKILLASALFFNSMIGVAQIGAYQGKPHYLIDTYRAGTKIGTIEVEMYPSIAPKHVRNFDSLVAAHFFDTTAFHRVVPGFVIQGGDPNGNGTGGKSIYGEKFEDEIDPSNAVYANGYQAGAIAMANSGPNTNGSQFFIMDTKYPLPPNYTIFGQVTDGQDVVNTIARVPRGPNDMPKDKVTFSVKVVK